MKSGTKSGEKRRDFYGFKPTVKNWYKTCKLFRREEETVINKLRLGHTRVMHGYIFDYERNVREIPKCEKLYLRSSSYGKRCYCEGIDWKCNSIFERNMNL